MAEDGPPMPSEEENLNGGTTINGGSKSEESNLNGDTKSSEEDSANKSESVADADDNLDNSAENGEKENGAGEGIASTDETQDQLAQMVMELSFHNDYLKAQIEGMGDEQIRSVRASSGEIGSGQVGDASDDVRLLREQIESLNREIGVQKETQKAAEDALEHLRRSYSEADAKVQELSTKLVEGELLCFYLLLYFLLSTMFDLFLLKLTEQFYIVNQVFLCTKRKHRKKKCIPCQHDV